MKRHMALLAVLIATVGCKVPGTHNLPPAAQLMHPGPGVDGPGPGVMMGQAVTPFTARTSQVAFVGPDSMQVNWDVSAPGQFDSDPIICPGRYNFPQGAIYRLKLTNISADRPGLELYPTLELAPSLPRTDAYLAHNAIPVSFSEEDFDQVTSGNFVTKVIYLPDPEYQELAIAGVETLVSTRLDPGVDPIVEADRRGSILGIVRLGNKDLQIPAMNGVSGGVVQAAYYAGMGGPGGAVAAAVPGGPVSGVTVPQYGMSMSGTPIGLPGPPHVPFGIPAGLRKHVIRNHTHQHIPGPTRSVRIDVKQSPGFSYPKPASRAFIHEQTVAPPAIYRQPLSDKLQLVPQGR